MKSPLLCAVILAWLSLVGTGLRTGAIVWIFHDEDPDYQTPPFDDRLTVLDDAGRPYFTRGGFNTSQTIGGHRAIACVGDGSSLLVCENVANRMSKIGAGGDVIFSIARPIAAVDVTKALGWGGVANYALGVFNGTADGRSAGNTDFDDDKIVAGRLFFHPFLKSGLKPLHGLGVGVSGTYGNVEGSTGLPDDRGYGTEGQQGFFEYLTGDGTSAATANVIADGTHWRVGPQSYWYWGPFGLLGEYAISSQRLQRRAGRSPSLARRTEPGPLA